MTTSAAELERLVRRYVEEFWNRGDAAVADELLAPDFVAHDPAFPGRAGVEGERRALRAYRTAFPDLRFTVEDQLVQVDRVAVRWVSRGTHRGDLLGLPPTGRAAMASGITILRVAGGRLAELWQEWDQLGLLRQRA